MVSRAESDMLEWLLLLDECDVVWLEDDFCVWFDDCLDSSCWDDWPCDWEVFLSSSCSHWDNASLTFESSVSALEDDVLLWCDWSSEWEEWLLSEGMSELVFLFDVTSLESLLSLLVESSLFEAEDDWLVWSSDCS